MISEEKKESRIAAAGPVLVLEPEAVLLGRGMRVDDLVVGFAGTIGGVGGE